MKGGAAPLTTVVRAVRRQVIRWALRLNRGQPKDGVIDLLPPASRSMLLRDGLDPVGTLADLRDREPISPLALPLGVRGWLVTGYHDARAVLADADSFSNDYRNVVGRGALTAEKDPGGLGMADPPDHTRLRRLVGPDFTARRLARLVPFVQGVVDDRLDAMADAAHDRPAASIDLVPAFAVPIPALTISALLGIAPEDRDEFMAHCGGRFDVTGGLSGSLDAIGGSLEFLRGVIAVQRKVPGDGLLGRIIAQHGDDVSDAELAGLADGVLTGGFESTASTLALCAIVLSRDAAARRVVRDGDPAEVGAVVDELLRYLSVVQVAFPRFARKRIEISGVTIEEGDVVVCSLSAANRDPVLGAGLDAIRLTPAEASHLAFGYGVHRCVGAELARLELRIALPALFRRFPNLEIAPEELEFRGLSLVFGVDALPVMVEPTR